MKNQTQKNALNIREIYTTFQGEQNIMGIGAPVIFVRLQGCKIRCYKKTLGTLCDTPEALGFVGGTEMSIQDIIENVRGIRKDTGISLICLSGGDPLHQDTEMVILLMRRLAANGFTVSVETSGIDIDLIKIKKQYVGEEGNSNFSAFPSEVSFVIDCKSKSAGIPKYKERNVLLNEKAVPLLTAKDFIKFVLYDTDDFNEMLTVISYLRLYNPYVNIVVGCFWQSPYMDDIMLFGLLKEAGLLGFVKMNFQVHKMSLLVKECTESLTTFNFDNVQI